MCLSNYLLYPSRSYKCWTSLGVDNWSSSSQLLHFMYVKVPKRAAVSLPNTSKNLKGEKHLSGLWKVLAARQPVQEFYTSTTALLVMLMLLSLKNGDLLNYLEFQTYVRHGSIRVIIIFCQRESIYLPWK